jgi:hypothetical protein
MMITRTFSIILLTALSMTPGSIAFSSSMTAKSGIDRLHSYASPSALHLGIAWEDYDDAASSDFMMLRAEACANSESCSLEEAQICLDEILHIQQNCMASAVLSKAAVCENVDRAADVVSKLRQKIEVESKRLAPVRAGVNVINVVLGFAVVSMILHGIAADPNVPVNYVVPITFQEFFWSVRDGYFNLLVSEWFKHGGLAVDPAVFEARVVDFTPQEWLWSIQNGSFGRMLEENMRYGGLLVDPSYDTETAPITLQEGWWALTGGYGNNALNHFFRNGGL